MVDLDVDEADVRVESTTRTVGMGQFARSLGVAVGDVDAERALGLQDGLGRRERDAHATCHAGAGVGEHGELQAVLLGGRQQLVGILWADRRPVWP